MLRDRMASLVTGGYVAISTPVASTDPISGVTCILTIPIPRCTATRIRMKSGILQAKPLFKKSHPILDLHPPNLNHFVNLGDGAISRHDTIYRLLDLPTRVASHDYAVLPRLSLRKKNPPRSYMRPLQCYLDSDLLLVANHSVPDLSVRTDRPPPRSPCIFLVNRQRLRHPTWITPSRYQVISRKRLASPSGFVHPSTCCRRSQKMEICTVQKRSACAGFEI